MDDEFELEVLAEENEFQEILQHPSIARIKEEEGVRAKNRNSLGGKRHVENAENSRPVEAESPPKKVILSTVTLPERSKNDRAIRTPKNFENMSLSEIISTRGAGERTSGQESRDGYENLSLDEIIRRKREVDEISCSDDISEACGLQPQKKRARASLANSKTTLRSLGSNSSLNKVGGSKEVTYTPESGIRKLCDLGYMIVIELNEMIHEDHPEFRARRWRVCFYDGRDKDSKIVGMGEAPRKSLAKESAALDFLAKIQADRPDIPLLKYAVPKGCRISPSVLAAVENLCDKADIEKPSFSEDLVMIRGREKYQFTVIVGGREFKDNSYNYKYAKYGAAKKAFDALNEQRREFTLDKIIKGDDCLDDSEYVFVECEELHVVHTNKALPKRILGYETCLMSASSSPTPWSDNESNGGISGRDSPRSCVSTSTGAKRIKIAPVSDYIIPPSLQKIRQRIENRSMPSNSVVDESMKHANDILTPNYGQVEEIYQTSNGVGPLKQVEDELRKPIQNLTITICADRNNETVLGNPGDADSTEKQSQSMELNGETIYKIWGSELRQAILDDMEPSNSASLGEEEVKEPCTAGVFKLNPFQQKPRNSHFQSDDKCYIHEVTLTGFGFGEYFKFSEVGATISALKNFRWMKNLIDAEISTNDDPENDYTMA